MTKEKGNRRISRREFARGGALIAASAALPAMAGPSAGAQVAAHEPTLASASQAEVDAKVSVVIRQYGNLLSDEEKLDVRRLLTEGQAGLDTMRAFRLDNADQPANVLKLYPEAAAAPAPTVAPSRARAAAVPRPSSAK
jgi:hypothetical protein